MPPSARLFVSFICIAVVLGASLAPMQLQKLPVELASFEATADGENTEELSWQTASETNNEGFEVQRQLGEDDWTSLGFVESPASGGTTSEPTSYRYTAEDVPAGSQQFRLKQVDLDGDSTYSDTVSVDVLPVELVGFQGTATKRGARLTWKTASEANNAGFEVHRRPREDAGWKQIGYVESKAEGGTTTEAKSYQHTVEDLSVGTHRFRLKQVDLDGSSQVYGPISVDVQMQEALKLTAPAPNPVSSTATLSFAVKEQAEATVAVYDLLGRRVQTLYGGTPTPGQQQRVQMDASTLPSGAYLLRLRAAGRTETQRVTVLR